MFQHVSEPLVPPRKKPTDPGELLSHHGNLASGLLFILPVEPTSRHSAEPAGEWLVRSIRLRPAARRDALPVRAGITVCSVQLIADAGQVAAA
jgi:hypothetical protein